MLANWLRLSSQGEGTETRALASGRILWTHWICFIFQVGKRSEPVGNWPSSTSPSEAIDQREGGQQTGCRVTTPLLKRLITQNCWRQNGHHPWATGNPAVVSARPKKTKKTTASDDLCHLSISPSFTPSLSLPPLSQFFCHFLLCLFLGQISVILPRLPPRWKPAISSSSGEHLGPIQPASHSLPTVLALWLDLTTISVAHYHPTT